MKKILSMIAATGLTHVVFGQGAVLVENSNNSSTGHWNLNTANGPSAPVGTDVALLWYNGASFVQIGSTYTTTAANGDSAEAGYGLSFYGTGAPTIVPTYSSTGTFEVQGWTGGYASYAAAVINGAYVGQTAAFTATEANEATTPKGTPLSITQPTEVNIPGQWGGNLVLITPSPEPSTIAVGGLGAAALWLFRRRK